MHIKTSSKIRREDAIWKSYLHMVNIETDVIILVGVILFREVDKNIVGRVP
jgi:hypothetical protein